jgi:hypothetical protein
MNRIILRLAKFGAMLVVVAAALLVIGSVSGTKVVRQVHASVKPAVVSCGITLSGSHFFSAWSGVYGGTPYSGELNATFSGGNFAGTLTYYIDGTPGTQALTGTYTTPASSVNGTCTSTLTVNSAYTFAMTLVNFEAVLLNETDANGTMGAVLSPIFH